MNDRFDDEQTPRPPEMAALDAELSSIRYEERPSFGPELEAELTREWRRVRYRRPVPIHALVAAALAGLLLVGVAVPQARASLVRFVTRLQSTHSSTAQASRSSAAEPTVQRAPAGPPATGDVLPAVTSRRDSVARPAPDMPLAGPAVTFPKLLDRPGAEALIQRHYPVALQRAGVGGKVRLRLWVDSVGSVDFVALARSSGVPDLDRAALGVAPSFHFRPARRFGAGVGTWVEFDVEFKQPVSDQHDSTSLPKVKPLPHPEAPDTERPDLTPQWQKGAVLSDPVRRGPGDLLRAAIGSDEVLDRLGPIKGVLEGEPPAGAAPTRWRAEVGGALEQAIARDPDNPAPFLALGRLRRKQGLRKEADALFQRGLQRAEQAERTTSPELLAALEYERGRLLEESWLGSRNLGTVSRSALPAGACPQAGATGNGSRSVSSDELIALNYMCPGDLAEVWRTGFRPDSEGVPRAFEGMMSSFRAAVEAQPDNVGANVGLLLGLADEGRWREVLDGARRFVQASDGNPDALLLSGLALERLRRPEEAEVQFHLALQGMPAVEAAELEDLRSVATPARLAEYANVRAEDRQAWLDAFWTPLDPILSTAVNERRVEHLARAAYAHLRFGSTTSEPGRVWMRYGRPERIRVIASGSDVHTEFWDYGPGPDLTFRRVVPSTDVSLTSEGRSYLEDLAQVYPQGYGSAGRLVTPLAGQVTRFRGTAPATTEIEIDTEVPDAMATGGTDSLDLSVFQLGPDGRKVWSVRHRVPAERVPISLESVGSPNVRTIAVELMDRATGNVATLRAQAHPKAAHPGDPSASDLLLTSPDVPKGWKHTPERSWLQAKTLAGPVAGTAVGAYFELYDLPASVHWYRLRAELRDRDTGEASGVPIEPAGESGFRPTWDFRPTPGKVSRNLVLVDLSHVPAGSYTLRLVADMPGASSPVTVERDLTVRR